MILNKYYLIVLSILFLVSCEEQNDETCILNGIEITIQATSFTEWKYFSITDTGFVELDWMPDSIAQISFECADVTMLASSTVEISDPQEAKAVLKLIDLLDEDDDVQDVYANFDIPDDVLENL